MEIFIDTKSSEPVYAQIVSQIRAAVQQGALKAGHSLPPVRQLAGDLMINPNTVAKAYKMLERERVVRGAGRQGTFIEEDASAQIELGNHQDARHEIETVLKSLKARGLSTTQLKLILFDQIEKVGGDAEPGDDGQISFKGAGLSTRFPTFLTGKKGDSNV